MYIYIFSAPHFLSATNHLVNIRLHMAFKLGLKIFWKKRNYNF